MKVLSYIIMSGLVSTAMAAPEYIPIQERAQAQSLAGGILTNDSLYANPAAGAFTRVYSVAGSLGLPRTFDVSVLDTKNGQVGGAMGYFQNNSSGDQVTSRGAKLSFMSAISDKLAVGVAGKWIWVPQGENVDSLSHKDVDVGGLFRFDQVSFGLVGYNVLGGDSAVGLERELGLAGQIKIAQAAIVSVAVKGKWEDFSPYQYGLGAEYLTSAKFSLKGGYRIVTDASDFWSLGLSYAAPKFTVHYAVEFPTGENERTEHVFGIAMMM